MRNVVLIILCIGIVLAGSNCTSTTINATKTIMETPTPSTIILTSTSTPDPLATKTSSLTPKPTQQVKLCPSEALADYERAQFTGTIIMDRDRKSSGIFMKLDIPYLYDLDTDISTPVSVDGYNFIVSSNRTSMFYQSMDIDNIEGYFSDKSGTVLNTISLPPGELLGWYNHQILIQLIEDDTYIQYDLNTASFTNLPTEFPNRYISESFRNIYSEVYFDPTLTKAFYFGHDTVEDTYFFSIWDFASNQEINHFQQNVFSDAGYPAVWSSKGDFVIIHALSPGGEIQLIRLDNNGSYQSLMDGKIVYFSISPDDSQLAFWERNKKNDAWMLKSLNMQTNEITDYCFTNSSYLPSPPIWSPDNQNITVELYADDGMSSKVIAINLESFTYIQFGENAMPIGWLR